MGALLAGVLVAALGVALPAAPAMASTGSNIAALARANLGNGACSTNSRGGTAYYTSCTGNGGQPEYWCADFAKWVWAQEGVDVSGIDPAAASFEVDGVGSAPHVGDAVLFSNDGTAGGVHHVAIVTQVNADGTIVSVGGDENGESGSEAHYSSTSYVAQDGPYPSAVGDPGLNGPIYGYVSPPTGSTPPPGGNKPANSQWVNTFAAASGYAGPDTDSPVGTLYAGSNYVYCRTWGARVGSSSAYNHWWLWTDLDTGGQGYVSAYYLKGQGNDEADDTSGKAIRACPSGTGSAPAYTKHWITTFTSASGYAGPDTDSPVGTLYAGSNYVYCRTWGARVGSSSAYNHWWLWTDLDTGGQGYVSAYYLKNQGNDEANDPATGQPLPSC